MLDRRFVVGRRTVGGGDYSQEGLVDPKVLLRQPHLEGFGGRRPVKSRPYPLHVTLVPDDGPHKVILLPAGLAITTTAATTAASVHSFLLATSAVARAAVVRAAVARAAVGRSAAASVLEGVDFERFAVLVQDYFTPFVPLGLQPHVDNLEQIGEVVVDEGHVGFSLFSGDFGSRFQRVDHGREIVPQRRPLVLFLLVLVQGNPSTIDLADESLVFGLGGVDHALVGVLRHGAYPLDAIEFAFQVGLSLGYLVLQSCRGRPPSRGAHDNYHATKHPEMVLL